MTRQLWTHLMSRIQPDRSAPGGRPKPSKPSPARRPLRVLVVDDHPNVRDSLSMLLKAHRGFEVVGAVADGAAAVVASLAHEPDVVVIDYSIPHLDGAEATRWIVEARPGVRVIGLSMHDDPAVAAAMRAAGAAAFVNKDRGTAALVEAIRGRDIDAR